MKKQTKTKKLTHKNETIVLLTPVSLQGVQGAGPPVYGACQTTCSSSVPP